MRTAALAVLTAAVMLLAACAGSTTADSTADAARAMPASGVTAPVATSPEAVQHGMASSNSNAGDAAKTAQAGASQRASTTPASPPAPAKSIVVQSGQATGIAGRIKPAPPMSTQLPPERLPDTGAPPRLDSSCRTSADCAVKNVGNCCGAMPACVNRNSPTNPEAVKAQCARRGLMSTCGFRDVQSCTCVAGTCQDSGGPAVEAQ